MQESVGRYQMEFILSWVKSGLLFGILASVILMLSPSKSYQKHIGLVVGMLFILVMLHPVMQMLEIDGKTYASYITNYFKLEGDTSSISEEDIALYGESIALQLKEILREKGLETEQIEVKTDNEGTIEGVNIVIIKSISAQEIENTLRAILGEGVEINYEYKGNVE